MTLSFFGAVQDDFQAVDRLVADSLSSRVPLVEEISAYLIGAGGKRLRPLLVLLGALGCGYGGRDHIKLAAVIEFLHTAMLLHDDVVDNSELRRGKKTVNANWGNGQSVLVGDFLHSRAFEMMVEIGDMRIMALLSQATNIIAEGEVQQLGSIRNLSTTEDEYLEIISRKTARLFQASAHAAAVLADANTAAETALRDYGSHLGMAFQLVDDQLDYSGHPGELGKNAGDDLAQGKVTLPLILAMRNGTKEQRCFMMEVITRTSGKCPDKEAMSKMVQIIRDTGGIAYTLELAARQKQMALDCLEAIEDSVYKSALENLVNFVVDRSH